VVNEQIRISAKDLGAVALPDFCPRCFWVKLRLRNRLPFQIFPGIFSSIDAYTKRVVHAWFDTHQCCPCWLQNLGVLCGYREPPHYSKFMLLDPTYNILLTGSPDGVFICADQSHIIIDYKTAKYTGTQDHLYPMYEAQLNAYALIGEQRGLTPVSALALVYMEPITDDGAAINGMSHRDKGFAMGFQANVHAVSLNSRLILPLLARTREIYDLPKSPAGRSGCQDCQRLEELVKLAAV
jgi:hypothetical protein